MQNYNNSTYKFCTFGILKTDNLTDSFILPQGEPLPKEYESLSRQELKQRLTVFIAELLDTNFEKLCSMVYRHDVSEVKFNQALGGGSLEAQAAKIADLVIDRELEKVKTRIAYRREKEEKKKNNLGESR